MLQGGEPPIEWDEEADAATASGGRTVRLSRRGLPAELSVGPERLLAAPVQLRLTAAGSGATGRKREELRWGVRGPLHTHASESLVRWSAEGAVLKGAARVAAAANPAAASRAAATSGVPSGGQKQQAAAAKTGGAAPPEGGAHAHAFEADRGGDSACHRLRVEVSGEMAPDGVVEMSARLHLAGGGGGGAGGEWRGGGAVASCSLADVALELPLRRDAVPLLNGLGQRGGPRPPQVRWRWDDWADHAQRGLNGRVWLGSATAGLQLNLRSDEQARQTASSGCGHDEEGVLQCADLSGAQFNVALGSVVWQNGNRGSASVSDTLLERRRGYRAAGADGNAEQREVEDTADSDGAVVSAGAAAREGGGGGDEVVALLRVSTGRLAITGGGKGMVLRWRLLLTPVRNAGASARADFDTRYVHLTRYAPIEVSLQVTARPWIILHRGNQLNPYTNYPFDPPATERLRDFIALAHGVGAKVMCALPGARRRGVGTPAAAHADEVAP